MHDNNSYLTLTKARAVFAVSRLRMGIDGKGVTTLVTFMGCPLHCRYCLNDFCHEDIYNEDGHTVRKGIRMLTPQELYDIVKQDNIYFQATGGGICFGGGEPTLQADFIEEFAQICPANWKLTLETCLRCSHGAIKRLAPYISEWIVDIKDMNSHIYKMYTGERSAVFQHLSNIRELVSMEKVTVKVPLIPDYNTEEDVQRSISELKKMGFVRIVRVKYLKWKSTEMGYKQ